MVATVLSGMAVTSVVSVGFVAVLAIGAYCALCVVALFYLDLPDEPPYVFLEDVVFAVTLPFVIGVAVLTAIRRS